MSDLIYFFGRLHVLALHVPIGLVVAAVAADWLSRRSRRARLSAAAPFLWGAAAISAVLTVALGYMHFAEGGFTGPSAAAHRLYGTLVAVACIVVWWLSARRPALHRRLNVVAGPLLLLLVTVTGHYGGNLTHGPDYLVAYAPQPVRSLLGLAERRPPVTDLDSADPWHDVVGPLLAARCASCHNDDKRSGGFSVADYAATLAGGETGSAVVPGNAEFSELLRRVSLPADDEAFMPAEGKTPLTAAQTQILQWWIAAGAPIDTTLAELDVPASVEALLTVEVGLGTADDSPTQSVAAADSALVERLFAAGFLVRQLSQTDPRLTVKVYSTGTAVDGAQLDALRQAADSIVDLDLHDAGIGDAAAATLAELNRLESLRLSRNSLTDTGIRRLARLPALRVLNLYGNHNVTDASLESIATMPSIGTLYLWDTGVTAEGVAKLVADRPDLRVDHGALTLPPRSSEAGVPPANP